MITPNMMKLIRKSQEPVINYELQQFETDSKGYFFSRRVDGEYEVCIVRDYDLHIFFEAME